MEQWNFIFPEYYMELEKRNSRVYHRPLDVYTGRLEDWQELKSGDAGTGSWVRWMSWKRFSAWRTMSPGCGDALAAQMAVSGS